MSEKIENNIEASVQRLLVREMARARDFKGSPYELPKPQDIEIPENDDYLAMLTAIPRNFLEQINMNYLLQVVPSDIEGRYPAGNKFCYGVFTFDELGYDKDCMDCTPGSWQKFLEKKGFMRPLYIIEKDGNFVGYKKKGMTEGFGKSYYYGYYYEFLPDLLKKDIKQGGCSFVLNYPRGSREEKRDWFISNCLIAVNNLKMALIRYNKRQIQQYSKCS